MTVSDTFHRKTCLQNYLLVAEWPLNSTHSLTCPLFDTTRLASQVRSWLVVKYIEHFYMSARLEVRQRRLAGRKRGNCGNVS